MKITLPSGIVIEADQVDIHPDGSFSVRDTAVEAEKIEKEKNWKLNELRAQMTHAERKAYNALVELGGKAHVDVIAEHIGITSGAASQRLRNLIDVGLVSRSQRAIYEVVED